MSSMRATHLVYLSAVFVVVSLFGGCGSNGGESDTGESVYWEKGKAGGSLSVAVDGEITGFNPFYGFETMAELLVHNLVFAAPIRQHPISGYLERHLFR